MKKIPTLLLLVLSVASFVQAQDCSFGSSDPICSMAELDTNSAADGFVTANTRYLDIVSWGKTRIIAEKTLAAGCENQQLVIDFPSNSITLISTLSLSTKRCADSNKGLTPTTAFSLVRHFGLAPNKNSNPFLTGK